MPLVNLVLALIVVGVALWLINRYIPMASSHQDDSECCCRGRGLRCGCCKWPDCGKRQQL